MSERSTAKPEERTEYHLRDGTISVILSDSSSISCELLASELKRLRALNLLKCVTTTAQLCSAVNQLQPDIALVSMHLADGPYSGFGALRQLQSATANTRAIMLMDKPQRELVVDAFRAGARGVFKKSAPLSGLYRCIHAVHSGHISANTEELQHLLEAVQRATPLRYSDSESYSILTRREQQIVPLVAAGLKDKEISDRLRMSEDTTRGHLFGIYEKLGISNRVELILHAVAQRNEAA